VSEHRILYIGEWTPNGDEYVWAWECSCGVACAPTTVKKARNASATAHLAAWGSV
jgi:hypothetical protein